MRSQIGDCSSCPSRPFCKEICPEAEQIIGQSTIPQNPNEHLAGLLPPKPLPHVDNLTHLTPTEIIILRFLTAGLTRREISEVLNISTNSVYVHISNMKKKYENS